MADNINPDHYKRLPSEAIEIIEAMIAGAPDNKAAYLHGQAAKYDLRLWKKGKSLEDFLSDWGKHIWYALRLESHLLELIEKQKSDEQQKASDIQSLKDHPFGKLRQPKWTPKVGDWVRIKKPADTQSSVCIWVGSMNKYDGQVIQVKEIEEGAVVHEDYGFLFSWLEPTEQPKASLNSDKIPEGYRKLGDSSEEPRQLGDLRWSVAAKRYIEISVDEVGYANRDNWAACRKVEPVVKQSLNTQPPDGWRWLEVGEVIRKGDKYRDLKSQTWIEVVAAIGDSLQDFHKPTIRRNRFEVGEKVVEFINNRIGVVKDIEAIGKGIGSGKAFLYHVEMQDTKGMILFSPHQLAPYIEDAK